MFRDVALLYMGLTVPTARLQDAAPGIVIFSEAARGEAAPILAWYPFESGPGNTNRNIVRVVNGNRQTVYMGLTVPTARPQDAAPGIVICGEAARGEAAPILAWYPSGSNHGHGFLYR